MDTSDQSEYLKWAVHMKNDNPDRVALMQTVYERCKNCDETLRDTIGSLIDYMSEDEIEAWLDYKRLLEEEEHI